mgnify:CR=1
SGYKHLKLSDRIKQIAPYFSVLDRLFIFQFTNTRSVSSSEDDRQTKIGKFMICSIDMNSKKLKLTQSLTL